MDNITINNTIDIKHFIKNSIFFDPKINKGTNVLELYYNERNFISQNHSEQLKYNKKNKNKNEYNKYLFFYILKNIYIQLNSGMSIHDISLPVFICEPRSMLEKITDFMGYPQFLIRL